MIIQQVMLVVLMYVAVPSVSAQDVSGFVIELEAGPVWQSRNDVQIPNTDAGTRFSLVDLAGKGPLPAARLYLTWNINDRHSLRGLARTACLHRNGFIYRSGGTSQVNPTYPEILLMPPTSSIPGDLATGIAF